MNQPTTRTTTTEKPVEKSESVHETSNPRPPDVVSLAQLWAGQFRHLATLGVAGAGGVLILLQAELMHLEDRWWLALGLFTLTAIFSMYGQITVVDEASAGEVPDRKARRLRGLALASLGAAGGAVITILVRQYYA